MTLPVSVGGLARFGSCSKISPLLSVLRKRIIIGLFSFFSVFICHFLDSIFTGTDRKGRHNRIGPDCAGDA